MPNAADSATTEAAVVVFPLFLMSPEQHLWIGQLPLGEVAGGAFNGHQPAEPKGLWIPWPARRPVCHRPFRGHFARTLLSCQG